MGLTHRDKEAHISRKGNNCCSRLPFKRRIHFWNLQVRPDWKGRASETQFDHTCIYKEESYEG